MSRRPRLSVVAGLLAVGLATGARAAERSGCVACHLDEGMLVKNLGGAVAKKSAAQSGTG